MVEVNLAKNLNEIIKSGIPKSVTIDGKRIYISKKIIKKIKEGSGTEGQTSGGLLPLAALLPIIFGALGAAGGVAGGVANVVQSAKTSQKADAEKKLAEERLKNLQNSSKKGENEKSKKDNEEEGGSGIFLNPYEGRGQSITLTSEQGSGLSDFLKNILKNSNIEKPEKTELKNIFKNLKHGIKIERTGSGIFLNPYTKNNNNN